MINRRHFLVNAAALGAAGHAPPDLAREPEGDLDNGCLGHLVAKSPFVLSGEVASVGPEVIGCGGGPSLLERSCTFRVTEAITGAKPSGEIHVSVVRFAEAPGPALKPGLALVLFLRPSRGAAGPGAERIRW